ncbi:hypothetical protein [Streptosporangium sandarakinum]|uniref:Uncharacterized protein n=1 Tax=Streptosporangium sandarakinum TaxID=1260955 RepID=A0A852UR47_9ACTN|nr:hypothetical protein [Streptosporangium sandarakinum]NYF38689.1 hypothetical protein [Streptosporangium sandarakinum]
MPNAFLDAMAALFGADDDPHFGDDTHALDEDDDIDEAEDLDDDFR